jgi:hypothetical protein
MRSTRDSRGATVLITNHVLAGTLIGLRATSVPAALGVGLGSHFVMDAVPHWGVEAHDEYLRVAKVDGLTGLAVSAVVLAAAPPVDRIRVAAGIFGACFPDTNQVSAHFFGRTFHPAWFDRFHGVIQTEHGWLRQEVIVAGALAVVVGAAVAARRDGQHEV